MAYIDRIPARSGGWSPTLFGVLLVLIGLVLLGMGGQLARLGGSWYYVVAGGLLVVSGVQLVRRRSSTLPVFALAFVGTVLWSYWEVGLAFWPLVPRLAPWLVLAFAMALVTSNIWTMQRGLAYLVALVLLVAMVWGGSAMFQEHGGIRNAVQLTPPPAMPLGQAQQQRWEYYGRTPGGTRYAPFLQITPQNVDKLQVAWTFRSGDIAGKGAEDQSTPTQIGDTLYICTPYAKIIALDADTGTEKWRFDSKSADSKLWNRCRGVAHYDATAYAQRHPEDAVAHASATAAHCTRRVFIGTPDARLMAVDAANGQPCAGFGSHGEVDLKVGMGLVQPFYYMPTSMPTVMGNRVVLGGWVQDGASTDEPSGVVRAFSADTGELLWAWDPDNPDITKLPPPGQTYSRTTPNVWAPPSFDEKLGLVYLPTGNQTPDFFGGHRRPLSDKYSSSVVALDITTGAVKWHFQTTRHDLWDYDIPSQPALVDLPDGSNGPVPALVQLTKRGQIFVLNRATGEPLAAVEDKPAPTNAEKGDYAAPTQPYSTGMPAIGAEPLTEASMWGATFFDQLACRIAFKKMRYDGDFTLAHEAYKTLQFPGNYGGFNWGSAAIDEHNGILYANSMRMPMWIQFIPRAQADNPNAPGGHDGLHVQAGTPYGAIKGTFMSPLGIPCHAPPYGEISAIDLRSKTIVWQKPLGTVQDTLLPIGIKGTLPIPIGVPVMGGPMVTAGGVVFVGGSYDYYLRALDAATGKELWKGRLPVGGQATPMTFVSPKTGRQMVVLSVGGQRNSPDRGDYIMAWALPQP